MLVSFAGVEYRLAGDRLIKANVGDTTVRNGVTLTLNENHRWTKARVDADANQNTTEESAAPQRSQSKKAKPSPDQDRADYRQIREKYRANIDALEKAVGDDSNPKDQKVAKKKLKQLNEAIDEEQLGFVISTVKGRLSKPKLQKEHGMSNSEEMLSASFSGCNYHFLATRRKMIGGVPEDVPMDFNRWHPAVQMIKGNLDANLPDSLLKHTTDVYLSGQRNDADQHWEKEFGIKNFVSAATGGDGTVVFYNGMSDHGTFIHEAGHNLAQGRWGDTAPPENSDFEKARKHRKAPTEYGKNNADEDFAETVQLFFEKPDKLKLKDPLRYEAVKRMVEDETYGG